jgi:hypothetical protein
LLAFKKEGIFNVGLGIKGKSDDRKNGKAHYIFKPVRIISEKKSLNYLRGSRFLVIIHLTLSKILITGIKTFL